MSRGDLTISRWLEAHCDRSAGLTTFNRSAILADVSGDGDHRLVLIDLNFETDKRSRLKVYKGTLLSSDQVLPDIPSSIISFYGDNLEPRVPAIGVACGSDLLIYKNNKPFYKFCIPPSPLNPLEEEVWKRLQTADCDLDKAVADLKSIRFDKLSGRSQEFLLLPPSQLLEYTKRFNGTPPVMTSTIVCMSTVNRNTHDKTGVACPVLGTEDGAIYILDPQTFTVLQQANVSSVKATPVLLQTSGMFDVEFRLLVACRENRVCLLRRSWVEGKILIKLNQDIVDMILIPGDDFVVIATTAKMLHCYTRRGQRLWTTDTNNSVTCLCLVPLKHLSTNLIGVGLKGGFIHFYHGRHHVDYTNSPDAPSALVFGQLGQEEHVLVVITMAGTINFKILKRTADFNLSNQDKLAPPTSQNKPLPLPKRSKLFIEQSMRERQNPVEMHQTFQQDLVRLRLTAARALVQNLSDQTGTGNASEQVKLSAQVLGLGPKFTLILTLENMSSERPVCHFRVLYHVKSTLYELSKYLIEVPLVPPGLSYKIETRVTQMATQENDEQVIRVFVIRRGQTQPVIAANITMPPTETETLL